MTLQYPYALRTLQSVAELRYHLVARCEGCGHFQSLDLKELIAQLGPDFDLVDRAAELQDVVSCLRCGRPRIPVQLMPYAPESGASGVE